ncbi:MAG: DUF3368 domain-containing protein [Acidobacteria bacterium]|nr:DUF3368 domain-containing protein [Acidobacteriota bacterium]
MQRGLLVTGTIGVPEKAAKLNLVNLLEALEKLQQTNFRCEEPMLREALERDTRASRRWTQSRCDNRVA